MQPVQFFAVNHLTGVVIPNASITVWQSGTNQTTLATLYSDAGITPISNPTAADSNGKVYFFSGSSPVDLQIASGSYSAPLMINVSVADPADQVAAAAAQVALATAQAGNSSTSAAVSASSATASAASASAAAASVTAALAAGKVYPSTTAGTNTGLTGATSLVGGSGGTNGTFSLTIPAPGSGGTQAVGTFTVSGGAVTAINITTAGNNYSGNVSLANSAFSASSGLTGASATLTQGGGVAFGQYFFVLQASTSSSFAELYLNSSGAAVDQNQAVPSAVALAAIQNSIPTLQYSWAVADGSDNVPLGVDLNGVVQAPLLNAPQSVSSPTFNVALDGTLHDETGANYYYAIVDANGYLVFGVDQNGNVVIPKQSSVASQTWATVTFDSSDTIVHIGDSYAEANYQLKDKAYISCLSQLSPYRHQNFGWSGNDALDMTYRMLSGAAYYDGKTFATTKAKYAIIASYTNDAQYLSAAGGYKYYEENLFRLIETCLALGVQPILSTEFTQDETAYVLTKRAADKYRLRFIDIQSRNVEVGTYVANPFWQGHPGTRTAAIFWHQMLQAIDELPQPSQGIKIFRRRSTFTVSAITDLLYSDRLGKYKRWKELTLTHSRIADGNEVYYEELDQYATINSGSPINLSREMDEYWNIRNGVATTFADYGLIEATLPGTSMTLTGARINLTVSAGVHVLVRNYLDPRKGVEGKGWPIGLPVNTTIAAGSNGMTLPQATISLASTTGLPPSGGVMEITTSAGVQIVEFSGVAGSTITGCTGGSGTMSTGGAAVCSFSSPTDPAYLSRWNTPRGNWLDLGAYTGQIVLSQALLQNAMLYDKLAILLYIPAGGAFTLSGVSIDYSGPGGKVNETPAPALRPNNTELLSAQVCGTSGELALWSTAGSPTTIVPIDQVNAPRNVALTGPVNGVCTVSATNVIAQTVTLPALGSNPRRFRLRVHARNFVKALLDNSHYHLDSTQVIDLSTGNTFANSLITRDTSDLLTLQAEVWAGPLVATTVASGSNGQDLSLGGTVNLASVSGLAASGGLFVTSSNGAQRVSYSGISGSAVTGCYGGSGLLATGGNVFSCPNAGGAILTDFVSLGWRAVDFYIDVPNAPLSSASPNNSQLSFVLSSPDGNIQIAKVSVMEVI